LAKGSWQEQLAGAKGSWQLARAVSRGKGQLAVGKEQLAEGSWQKAFYENKSSTTFNPLNNFQSSSTKPLNPKPLNY
jgi:hypothetical protein